MSDKYVFNFSTGKLDISDDIPELTFDPLSPVPETASVIVSNSTHQFTYYATNGDIVRGTLT